MEKYSKYPRTYHLHWSEGVQSDDKILSDLSCFEDLEIAVLEKLDGENTSLYPDYYHARSIDSNFNFTRAWIAKMHSVMKFDIPEGFKLVVENMWAEHSIRYTDLNSYAYLLSVWKSLGDDNICLSYDETKEWAELFDLPMPKELYRGVYDEKKLIALAESIDKEKVEGYVIRVVDSFSEKDMNKSLAKYVRKNHVQPDQEHWLKGARQNGELISPVKPFYMGK